MSAAAASPERRVSAGLFIVRLSPVIFLVLAAIAYVFHIEEADAYPWRNALPLLMIVALAAAVLGKGRGHWTGSGWRWPLAAAGFAVPVAGLTLYMHYGFATDLNGMYSNAIYPDELFRFLPMYTSVAGFTGFAIGWIIGRNVDESGAGRRVRQSD